MDPFIFWGLVAAELWLLGTWLVCEVRFAI